MKIKNYNFKLLILGIVLFSAYSLLLTASAHAWVIGEPLVPCGGAGQPSCTKCEFLHLVDNVIDFIMLAVAPILATVFFIWAGVYMMLGGTNPGMLANGKRIFTSTFIGILIVMLAWLITNTLILTLLKPAQPLGNIPFVSADWWHLQCSVIGW